MHGHHRLADIVGSLSLVADHGFGLPPLHAMSSSLIATDLARRLGVEGDELKASFYAPLLLHIGCISMSHETSALFGNEIAITRAVAMTNLGDPNDIVETLIPEVTKGLDRTAGEKTLGALAANPMFGKLYDTASAEVSRQAARRMLLPESVQEALFATSEAWNGEGFPLGLKGEAIPAAARITRLAADASFFNQVGGTELAIDAIRARSGTLHDPAIASTFVRHAEEVLDDMNADDHLAFLLKREPAPGIEIDDQGLEGVVAAFGDAADLKTPFTHGHSGASAELAAAAAERLGLEESATRDAKLAAYLHDVGRVAISNALWEKPGPLNGAEWEQVRMHAYHSERMVARSERLNGLARAVGMHHERLDGSGYHRGSTASEIATPARIVAVTDAWVSMRQDRPHRPALDADRAAAELQANARDGLLDPQVVNAVLDAAGLSVPRRTPLPRGLSAREVEVLRLLAAGRSNPEIADNLHISRRTAEHHVQHIYRKIDVSTRPGAAMFALEHGLLEPLGA
jgi:HD-GYP domain-containing protein (c-di-GMP phosphodiesterase class II)